MGGPPTLHTFTTSETLTAANLNLLSQAVQWLNSGKPDCRAHATSIQTLFTSTWTNITLGAVDSDTESGFASSAYTCKVAGYYLIQGSVAFVSGTGSRGGRFTVNGSAITSTAMWPGSTTYNSANATLITGHLAVNDVVRLQGFQSSGANLNTAVLIDSSHEETSFMNVALLHT